MHSDIVESEISFSMLHILLSVKLETMQNLIQLEVLKLEGMFRVSYLIKSEIGENKGIVHACDVRWNIRTLTAYSVPSWLLRPLS